MARRPRIRSRDPKTVAVLEALFAEPPVNEAELERRLSTIDVREAQRLLADRLRRGRVSVQEGSLYVAAFSAIGVGDQGDKLLHMAADRERAPHERAFAVAVLSSDDPEQLQALARTLSPTQAEALAEASVLDLLVGIEAEPERAEAVAGALVTLPEPMRHELLDQMEIGRVHLGASAATVYAEALASTGLATLRPRILAAIVAEGSMEGVALLERARDETKDPKARRDFQAALLRARTQAIEPGHESRPPDGYAYVGTCDGQGAFLVMGLFKNPDKSMTLADLCIRASSDIRDGFVVRRQSSKDLDIILHELRSNCGSAFCRVSLGEAARLVASAVDRTRELGRAIPRDAQAAVAMFDRARQPQTRPEENVPVPSTASLEALRGLLERDEYESTWFFDEGDLQGVGVDLPPRRRTSRKWLEGAAARLNTASIRRRVTAMARHMARWHSWNQEPELAALCQAAAEDAENAFRSSPLVRVMLEHSARMIDSPRETLVVALADPTARQHIKALFFREVLDPTGRDLAHLDMTEAAFLCLDQAFELLPGERRPREDDRNEASYVIGRVFADFVIRGAEAPQPVGPLADEITALLVSTCDLTPEEAHRVAPLVMANLGGFVSTVCASCPVSCLVRPDAEMADVFFEPSHPMAPNQGDR